MSKDSQKEEQEPDQHEKQADADSKDSKKDTVKKTKKAAKKNTKDDITEIKVDDKPLTHHDDDDAGEGFFEKYLNHIIIILLIILVANMGYIYLSNQDIFKGSDEPGLPQIEIIHIKASDCDICFDVKPLIDSLPQLNVEITSNKSFEFYDKEAKDLIKKYNIVKIPTFIVKGDIDSAPLSQLGNITDDVIVFSAVQPPYLDLSSGEVAGKVDVTIVRDLSCEACYDIEQLLPQMKFAGVHVADVQIVERENADELIEKYELHILPGFILSKEAEVYPAIKDTWKNIGRVAKDGSFVLDEIPPPYMDLETEEVKGQVTVTKITDKSCEECYDVNLHDQILGGMGVSVSEEIVYDKSSFKGKKMIKQYNIEAVPTIVISKDAEVYPAITQIWGQVGTVEEDGSYVFRNMGALRGSLYKNLSSGEVEGAIEEPPAEQVPKTEIPIEEEEEQAPEEITEENTNISQDNITQ